VFLDFGGDERVDGCDCREETGLVFGACEDVEAEDIEPRMSKWVTRRSEFGEATTQGL
jgi:hypothetical protein